MSPRSARRPDGRTLIELMIAMAIGLGMSIAVTALYSASRSSGQNSDLVVEVRSNGRLALQLLTEQLRMAGYGAYVSGSEGSQYKGSPRTGANASGVGFAVNGCDGRFINDGQAPAGCGTANANRASIAIAYHAPAASNSVNGRYVDCIGNTALTDASTPFGMVSNTYYVAVDSNTGMATLYCRGGGDSTQPLVSGIEQFVLRYGVDIGGDFSVDQMVSATDIRTQMASTPPLYDFSNVQSVEVCLVLRASRKGAVTAGANSLDCNEVAFASDGYYRQRFRTTATLRNKVFLP